MQNRMGPIETHNLVLDEIFALVSRAQGGDREAKDTICRQVQEYVRYAVTNRIDESLKTKVSPSDIVQQSLTRMFVGLESFQGKSAVEFLGWVNAIVQNEIHTTRRDLTRDRRDFRRDCAFDSGMVGLQHGHDSSPSEIVLRDERLDRFERVMSRLPPDYAQVIRLRSIEERSFEEVAKLMERSQNAVSKLWYRAIVKFQEELESLDESI
jgi:RNA polymerase sigma-70 factor (ECF subfamily)